MNDKQEELNKYANGLNKGKKLLSSMSCNDFSSLDYSKIKDTELFKHLELSTLQDYVNSKRKEKGEALKFYQRMYNLIKLTIIQAEQKQIKGTEIYYDSKHVINFNKQIKVKLFPIKWLKIIEKNLIADKPKKID